MQLWLVLMLLTADLKYHQFYEAENQLLLQILGILKANVIQKNYIVDYLRKKSLILQSFYQKKIQIQLSTYRIWRIRKN
jgi:superoxide dismutase